MLKVSYVHANATTPTRAHNSAGYDLYSPTSGTLLPHTVSKIPLGICTEFDSKWVAIIKDRSSLGARGIHVFGGVIDADYRGEWALCLYNSTSDTIPYRVGDRLAQVLFLSCGDLLTVDELELSQTTRGDGGFGSTGS